MIPEIVFVAFQATFAAITCCLILGAFAERAKFSAVLVFIVLWFTFSYTPIAHMVWFWMGPDAYTDPKLVDELTSKAGLIWQWGALDFAGGTVVHINAGVAGLVGAYLVGRRIGYGKEAMPAHNLPLTMIGASLLWVGWFGFNAGSALEAGNSAALAFLNTYLATACAVLSWSAGRGAVQGQADHARRRFRRSGRAGGDHAGRGQRRHCRCVRDRPGGGHRLPLGRERAEEAARRGRLARRVRRARGRRHHRRAADRRIQLAGPGRAGLRNRLGDSQDRLRLRIGDQLWVQAKAVGLTILWSGIVAFVAFKLVDLTIGLRVAEEDEREGLDTASHGEAAYRM